MTMRENQNTGNSTAAGFTLTPVAHSVRVAILPGLLAGFVPLGVAAAPTGGQVKAGNASIAQNASGTLTTIQQQSQRAAIDWQTFNVGKNQLVDFKQPNARASTLNRIFDQNPSQIFGQVKANGQVVLMNPNGVFFKPGARVNVGSLVAGAMQIGIDDFMQGRYTLNALKESAGRVINEGTIEAADGGDVTLVGKSVANHGVIVATAGKVNLVAGEQVTVDFDGDGLLRFAVDEAVLENAEALDDQISNTGDIVADGGDVLITASAADGVFRNAINNEGLVKAGRIENQGGRIMLVGMGPGASVLNTGQLQATGAAAGGDVLMQGDGLTRVGGDGSIDVSSSAGTGGSARVLGATVELTHNASIDASGASGGGEILVGGDYQGNNAAVQNAEHTFVSGAATLNADATVAGDGGKVIVWADDSTQYYGDISARGGDAGGDGGLAEVSGKETLVFRGNANLGAPAGDVGTLLLDPTTLTIIDAAAGGEEDPDLPSINTGTDQAGGANTVSWGQIAAQGANADVQLQASGLVTVNDVAGGGTAGVTDVTPGEIHLPFDAAGGGGSITIESTTGDVTFNNTSNVLVTEGGDVTILAAGTATVGGIRTSGAGNAGTGAAGSVQITSGTGGSVGSIVTDGATATITVNAGNMTQTAAIDDATGATTVLTKAGAGTLTLSQNNGYTGATTVNGGTLVATSNNNALGPTGGTTVATGATLDIDGITTAENVTLNGGTLRGTNAAIVNGTVTLGATGSSLDTATGTDTLAVNGVIDDGGSDHGLDKTGAGTVTLSAVNTHGDVTTVQAGTLIITDAAALGDLGAANRTDVAAGAVLHINGVNSAEHITLNGGVLRGSGAGSEASGPITLGAPGSSLDTTNVADVLTVSGSIDDGGGNEGLDKTGAGTVTLSAANAYGDVTTVNAGTLVVTNAAGLGDLGASDRTDVAAGATLNIDGVTVAEFVTLNGGTLQGTNAAGVSGAITLGAANSTLATTLLADSLTLSGTIDDGGSDHGLIKTGAGAVTLSGANGFGGELQLNAGTLTADTNATALGDSGATNHTTVAAGATLNIDGITVAEAVTLNGSTLRGTNTAAVTGAITLGAANSTLDTTLVADSLALSGVIDDGGSDHGLVKTGAGAVTLSAANTFGGELQVNGGTLNATTDAGALGDSGATNHTTVAAGATLNIDGLTVAEDVTLNGGTLRGTNAAAVTGAITIGAASSTLDTTLVADSLALSGIIDDSGSNFGLAKTGAGAVTLSAANTFGGELQVNGGTLNATTDAAALGDSGATNHTTVAAGAILNIDGLNVAEAITLNGGTLRGTNATTVSGAITIGAASSTLDTATGADSLALSGVIDDGGSNHGLIKSGLGELTLSGANTFGGELQLNGGTLTATTSNTALGDAGATNQTTVAAGAELHLNGINSGEAITLNGATLRGSAGGSEASGAITLNAPGNVFTTTLVGDVLTVSGAVDDLGGDQGLDKTGLGTVTLSAANSHGDVTTVQAGTLVITNAAALGDVGAADRTDVSAGAVLHINGVNTAEHITLNGGVLRGSGAGSEASGPITLGAPGSSVDTTNLADVLTISGVIDDGGANQGLDKTGAGTVTLSGANAYGDVTTVNAGTLAITDAAGLGDLGASNRTDVSAGAVLHINGVISGEHITLNGGTLRGSAAGSEASGPITLGAVGSAVDATNLADVLTVSGVIDDGGNNRGLDKTGAGTVTLGAANTFGGTTTINEGTVVIGNAASLSSVVVMDQDITNSTLDLNGVALVSLTSLTVGAAGGNTATVTNEGGADSTLSLDTTGGDFEFAGIISDGATNAILLDKAGTGTLTISNAANDYTGATTVTAGTLRAGAANVFDDSASMAVTGTFDVNNFDQTLKGLSGAGTVTNSGAGSHTLTVGDTPSTTFTGVIEDGAGTLALTKQGSGTLTLSGVNTYTGATTVTDGTLQALTTDDVIANSSGLNLTTNTAVFNLNGTNQTIARLDGVAGAIVTNTAAAASGARTLDISGGGGSFAGTLTDGTATATDGSDDLLNLTKSGSGTQTLTAAVVGNYGGAVSITGGTLSIGNSAGLGTVAGVTTTAVTGTGTLQIDNFALTSNEAIELAGTGDGGVGALTGNGLGASIAAGGTNTITLTADASVGATGGSSLTVDRAINETGGARALTKGGAGTVTLGVANGYTGTTTVNDGTLIVGVAGAITNAIVMDQETGKAAVLDLNGTNQTVTSLNDGDTSGATAARILNNSGASILEVTGSGTYSGDLDDGTGTLELRKTTGGTLTLNGAGSNYSGQTLITGGVLEITRPEALGTAAGQTTVNGGGQLELNIDSGADGAVTDQLNVQGASAILASNTNGTTVTGTVALDAATTITVDDGGGAGLLTLDGAVTGGAGATLTKAGPGTLELGSVVKAYTGLTDVQAGTLSLGVANAINTANSLNLAAGTTFDLNGFNQTLAAITDTATSTITNATAGATTAELTLSATNTLMSQLTNSGGGVLALRTSGGVLTLTNNANDYDGLTNVNAGATLAVTADGALGGSGAGSETVIAATGTFQVTSSITTGEDFILNGAGANTFHVDDSTGATIVLTLNGDITGAGDLTKTGVDVLAMGGDNDAHTGATAINAGTLRTLNNSGLGDASAVSIGAAGTLDIDATGTPGESIGSLAGAAGGTLDLGLGSLLATAGDINLTGLTVTIAATGNQNQSIDAGAGTLTTDANLIKNSSGSLTLGGATNIQIGGDVEVNDVPAAGNGNLVIADNFVLLGDLRAANNIDLSGVTGQVQGVGAQEIAAGGDGTGTLTTNGLTQNGAGTGTLTLEGQGAAGASQIIATGLIDVDTGTDNLLLNGNLETSVAGVAVRANGDIDFQGAGASSFTNAATQSVVAGDGGAGNITDSANSVLSKSGVNDLILTAAGSIGSGGNPIAVVVPGTLRAEATASGGDILVSSTQALTISRLQTTVNETNTIQITTTGVGSDLTLTGANGYAGIGGTPGDDITLSVDENLTVNGTALASNSLTATFGQNDGDPNTLTVDAGITTGAALTVTGGTGNDTFDINSTLSAGTTLTLNGGAGNDQVDIDAGLDAGTSVTVNGDADDDTINQRAGITDNNGGGFASQFNGGSGDDTFVIASGNEVLAIDGGGNTAVGDTLDFQAAGASITINILPGFDPGVGGQEISLTGAGVGTFAGNPVDIENLLLNAAQQNTVDASLATRGLTFDITALNEGDVSFTTGLANTFHWTNAGHLVGSAFNDVFDFAVGGFLQQTSAVGSGNGTIDGGNEITVDTLRFSAFGVDVTISAMGAGTVTHRTNGALSPISFSDIENIEGPDGILRGGREYTVTGDNSGIVVDAGITFDFNDVDLEGTALADIFRFNDGGFIDGFVEGLADGAGQDLLTYENRAAAVTIDLRADNATNDESDGTASDIGTNFRGIESYEGGTNNADQIIGEDTDTAWRIADSTCVAASSCATGFGLFFFDKFEIITGGTGADTFDVHGTIAGSLNDVDLGPNGELRGGAGIFSGNDTFRILNDTELTADINGGNGDDVVEFGLKRAMLPDPADGTGDASRIDGSIDLGAGDDTIDFSGIRQVGYAGDLISGTFSNVDTVIGNNSSQLTGQNVDTAWLITDSGTGEFTAAAPTPVFGQGSGSTTFRNFSILAGTANDTFYFGSQGTIAGGGTGQAVTFTADGTSGRNGTIRAGAGTTGIVDQGGTNILVGSTGNDFFTITGNDAVTLNVGGAAGPVSTLDGITHIDGSLSTGFSGTSFGAEFAELADTGAAGGNDTVNFNDGVSWSGFIDTGPGSDTLSLAAYTSTVTATIGTIDANGMDSTATNFISSGFRNVENFTTGTVADTVTLAVAPGSAAGVNQVNMGTGTDSLVSQVAASWQLAGAPGSGFVRPFPLTGSELAFSGVDNLSSNAASTLSLPTTAGAASSVAGTITAPSIDLLTGNNFVGPTGIRIASTVDRAGAAAITATGDGDILITGAYTGTGAFTSTVDTGGANYGPVDTGTFNQTYNGSTTFRGDLNGGNFAFDDAIIATDVTLTSNSAPNGVRIDFNGEVRSGTDPVFSIVPPVGTDIFIDTTPGVGHINADAFDNFNGTLSIGGKFVPAAIANPTLLDGTLESITADHIQIGTNFITGGNLLLAGSTIEFNSGSGADIEIGAGPAGGSGEFALFAVGDSVLGTTANGITGGTDLGNIAAQDAQTVTFTGGSATLASTNEIVNSTNMIMNLGGGSVLVAQSDTATNQQVDFNVRSNAVESTGSVTGTTLADSVAQLAGLNVGADLFANAQVFFPNPAAVLTILQAVAFVDSSLFEEDLSLFGVIGNGIALSLDQCEDAEGCAPSVTEEELAGLIGALNERISRLEGLLNNNGIDREEGQRLLAGYREQLQKFLDYQDELVAYNQRQEDEVFGDDFGDEFDDVFEAEETFDDGGEVLEPAVEDAPAEVIEEEVFEELEEFVEPLEDATPESIPEETFEDFDEGVETPEPEAPAPTLDAPPADAPDEFEELDFEELEEELEDALIKLLQPSQNVNQLAGAVRMDGAGAVVWTGELVLPALHRRY